MSAKKRKVRTAVFVLQCTDDLYTLTSLREALSYCRLYRRDACATCPTRGPVKYVPERSSHA